MNKPNIPEGNHIFLQLIANIRVLEDTRAFENRYTDGLRVTYNNGTSREIRFAPQIFPPIIPSSVVNLDPVIVPSSPESSFFNYNSWGSLDHINEEPNYENDPSNLSINSEDMENRPECLKKFLKSVYSSKNALEACSICIEDFKINAGIIRLECLHFFHIACIEEWAKNQSICPECRIPI